MRKDVKRSLLLWPLAASTTISAASWMHLTGIPSLRTALQRSQLPARVALALELHSTSIGDDAGLTERLSLETPELKLPQRVAEAFGTKPALPAPVRDQYSEMAGLVLEPPAISQVDQPLDCAPTEFPFNADRASELLTELQHIVSNRVLETLRNRAAVVATPASSVVETAVSTPPVVEAEPQLVGPVRPPYLRVEVPNEFPAPPANSVLPESVRALGRRVLISPLSDHPDSEGIVEFTPSAVEAAQPTMAPPRPTVVAPQATIVAPQTNFLSPQPDAITPAPNESEEPRSSSDANEISAAQQDRGQQRATASTRIVAWPVTQQLDQQLEEMLPAKSRGAGWSDQLISTPRTTSAMIRWSQDVTSRLNQLRDLPRLGDPQAGQLIEELSMLADEGEEQAEAIQDRQLQIEWLRASYAVARRVAIWNPIWQVTRSRNRWMVSDDPTGSLSIADAAQSVRSDLMETGDVDGWVQFLLLDEINTATSQDDNDQRTILAQRLLSRLDWHGLNTEQRRWLQRESVKGLSNAIRPWAQDAVDYANLLNQIERQESDTIDLAAIDIANAVQTLRFADQPRAIRVADSINTHYRNANVRLALSEPMLQRMLPTIEAKSIPVKTELQGNRIRGTSRIESELRVELNRSPDRWTLNLKTDGRVRTQSTGINGQIAVRTSRNSEFAAVTPIEVTARDVQVHGSAIDVRGTTRLRGIGTEYDGWPLIGSLVRSIASSRYESSAVRANRFADRQIESQVNDQIAAGLNQRLTAATQQLGKMVLGPLGKLRLDPRVMDMQTTESRLLARYRLAGDWQLGAFTARPRAPRTSLMSAQVHQSAINNTLEQLIPRDQPMTIRQMILSSAETFGQTGIELPADIPDDVTVRFAPTRPITVEIEEGRLWVTLRVIELTRQDRIRLTRFIVRAAYRPELSGLHATLVRDGHLRISGPGMSMRERLPVRAIFNKVLSPNRPLRLTLPQLTEHPMAEGLAVSQLELRDGWIGMAISESDAPRIALQTR